MKSVKSGHADDATEKEDAGTLRKEGCDKETKLVEELKLWFWPAGPWHASPIISTSAHFMHANCAVATKNSGPCTQS
jgi:hypothetical protein